MSFFRKRNRGRANLTEPSGQTIETGDRREIADGDIKYVIEKAGNDSEVSYQEASGAPVEVVSPLGYSVGSFTIILLNISKMVGTGIYSTRKSIVRYVAPNSPSHLAAAILTGTGSPGLSLIFWAIGFFTSISSLSVYLEYAAYFPNRSGSEVVYLEQAFPRPRYFFPIAFAVQTVILSFSSGNSIG
jgi:hypothetical protein